MCVLYSELHGVETNWLLNNEKVPSAVVSEGPDSESLHGHESIHHYWFPWKRCNWNSTSFAD